ncbi:transposase, partial [Pseudogulbenkiania subflava]|uniref:transposase n=7 Tax=Pseudogulbenkiania subflava TaxID=451637 RepID=UPI000A15C665
YVAHEQTVRKQEVEVFLQSLAERSSRERPTLLILDNARMHAAIREDKRDVWLLDHGFHLCFLPAYSPELNLIEQLWKQAKYHWRRCKTWGATELKSKVTDLLDRVGTELKFSYA